MAFQRKMGKLLDKSKKTENEILCIIKKKLKPKSKNIS